MPAVGDSAPEIALPDENGTIHRLADQRGRWTILYFYPADDTPGCTKEACDFRDRIDSISERGADVWGVSPQGAASKRAFREKYDLPFMLLTDEGHSVASAYGA
ncbi:MAG: peroxiredoxin, partial [Thermomicrobiales bacterium]